jgi:hypothetical protein
MAAAVMAMRVKESFMGGGYWRGMGKPLLVCWTMWSSSVRA